jgi:hypothetical protein
MGFSKEFVSGNNIQDWIRMLGNEETVNGLEVYNSSPELKSISEY